MDLTIKEIFLYIILPLGLLFIGWFLNTLYTNYVSMKPRLFLRLGTTFYGQRFFGFGDDRHELTWRYECVLNNNSGYVAYGIKIYEVTTKKRRFIFNNTGLTRIFPPNNHVDANKAEGFELATTYVTKPDELILSKIENGVKVYIPGLKIQNPSTQLKPKELKHIRLIIRYENEKGKVFYTKFSKTVNGETNKICFIKPYLFYKTTKLF